jgi:hypothetical protein
MDLYCKEIRKLEAKFYGIEYIHMVRDKNQAADALSNLGSSGAQNPHGVFVQDLVKPSIDKNLVGSSETEKARHCSSRPSRTSLRSVMTPTGVHPSSDTLQTALVSKQIRERTPSSVI